MDDFDRAQELEELERDRCLAEQRRKTAVVGQAVRDCEDCGGEIPEARLRAVPWVHTCVECARVRERLHDIYTRQ